MGVDEAATALATGLYLSYIPVKILQSFGVRRGRKWTGAGLIGTLEGLALTHFLPMSAGVFLAVLAAAVAAACWICGRAERVLGCHDDSRIVLDEIVGYWTTIAFLPRTTPILLYGLVLFRILDSVKLAPYRWLERLPGGIGIVADDVGAAVVANLLIRLTMKLCPACL
jgi:phosphatidylglycerophosphatase A